MVHPFLSLSALTSIRFIHSLPYCHACHLILLIDLNFTLSQLVQPQAWAICHKLFCHLFLDKLAELMLSNGHYFLTRFVFRLFYFVAGSSCRYVIELFNRSLNIFRTLLKSFRTLYYSRAVSTWTGWNWFNFLASISRQNFIYFFCGSVKKGIRIVWGKLNVWPENWLKTIRPIDMLMELQIWRKNLFLYIFFGPCGLWDSGRSLPVNRLALCSFHFILHTAHSLTRTSRWRSSFL